MVLVRERRDYKRPRHQAGLFLLSMTILERLMLAMLGVLVVVALVLAIKLDIGRNADIPPGGIGRTSSPYS